MCVCTRVFFLSVPICSDLHTCMLLSTSKPKALKGRPQWYMSPCVLSLSTFSGLSPFAVIKGPVCLFVCPYNYPWWAVLEPSSWLLDPFDKFGSCSQSCCWGTSGDCGCLGCVCVSLGVFCVIEGFIWQHWYPLVSSSVLRLIWDCTLHWTSGLVVDHWPLCVTV